MIVEFFGGWGFVGVPWLAGMVFLFAFEFIEGNTVTRLYFMRLRQLTQEALSVGSFTPQLKKAHAENVPTFTYFLDLPMLFLIVSLGALGLRGRIAHLNLHAGAPFGPRTYWSNSLARSAGETRSFPMPSASAPSRRSSGRANLGSDLRV